jgi:guanylate kinase
MPFNNKKIIVITAPSGSGKTTLVKQLMFQFPQLSFSVSACTRAARGGEVDGRDYYFLTEATFKSLLEQDAFIEWEMVYEGKYYGTLKTELDRIWEEEKVPLVDIDVKGALSIQSKYPEITSTIFIKAPSLEILSERLQNRGTETPESLKERIAKAVDELEFAEQFDYIIVNDNLEIAVAELTKIIASILMS